MQFQNSIDNLAEYLPYANFDALFVPFMTLLKENLLHEAQGARWGVTVQQNTKSENEVEVFTTPRSWRRYMALSRGLWVKL